MEQTLEMIRIVELPERHRIDETTHERLNDCSDRKGLDVSELVRMSFRAYDKATAPSLKYQPQTKSRFIGVENLMMHLDDDGIPPDLCAVVNWFLDDKDDGKTNEGRDDSQESNDDGTISCTAPMELPDVVEDQWGRVHSITFRCDESGEVWSHCSPRCSIARVDCVKSATGNPITCLNCANAIRTAKAYSVFQIRTQNNKETA